MKITLWKGHHESGLRDRIAAAFAREELLILCPPNLHEFSVLNPLPPGPLHFAGNWEPDEMRAAQSVPRVGEALPFRAVLGVFTSGTLSPTPRLALYSRDNLETALAGIFDLFNLARIRHVFCYPQAFHTFGLTLGYLAAVRFGWSLHTPRGKYGRSAHAERFKLNSADVLTLGTPTHFYDLIAYVRETGAGLAPSYSCIIGGAGVSRKLWGEVRDVLGIEAPSIGYGCTEAAPGISHLPPGLAPISDDEIGYPLASIHARVEAEGVMLSGGSLCPALITAKGIDFPERILIRDRISIRSDDGVWIYGGRLDLVLNRGGQKFALEAIEKRVGEILNGHIVACALPDERLGEDLGLAFISGNPGHLILETQALLMREWGLRVSPQNIISLPDMPLNASSKLDRFAVKQMLIASTRSENLSGQSTCERIPRDPSIAFEV